MAGRCSRGPHSCAENRKDVEGRGGGAERSSGPYCDSLHLEVAAELRGQSIDETSQRQQDDDGEDVGDQQGRPGAWLLEHMMNLRKGSEVGRQNPRVWLGLALGQWLTGDDIQSAHRPFSRMGPPLIAKHQHHLELSPLHALCRGQMMHVDAFG